MVLCWRCVQQKHLLCILMKIRATASFLLSYRDVTGSRPGLTPRAETSLLSLQMFVFLSVVVYSLTSVHLFIYLSVNLFSSLLAHGGSLVQLETPRMVRRVGFLSDSQSPFGSGMKTQPVPRNQTPITAHNQ